MAEISRRILMAATAGTLGLAGGSNLHGESQAGCSAQRPNVLMIQADQLMADVLGCYGGPVPTPNIDRLANEGALFTEATCVTPFCSPIRASILTGRYPHSHGIVTNVSRCEYPAHSTLPTELDMQSITTGNFTSLKIPCHIFPTCTVRATNMLTTWHRRFTR